MGEFWKKEWNLFLEDINAFTEFWTQPVVFSNNKNEMLRPSGEELQEKAELESEAGFWTREWNSFLQDVNNVKEFFTQPVMFK